MQLADFLDCDAIKTAFPAGNKRSLMKQLAELAAQRIDKDPAAVLAGLNEREQLGSTGFGHGVAIPHAKIEGLAEIYGLFVRLAEAVEYKAIDARPVDLVFVLLSPPDAGAEHLKALAAISRVTRDSATLERLRGARTRDALAAVLLGVDERDAA
ncbi:MAG TPA: PTS sugar transporter subunit IIA [Sphingomicrobium sp.]|nr:PTS sugar transporter subunit IIA [Sphingomicrobium sp.]